MASVNDYTFNTMARIGNDNCDLSQRNVQNVESANYMLTNFGANDCTMQKPIQFATNQPSVFYSGSHQTGIGGCNIDTNSELLIGSSLSKPACKISLFQRPFATVPYLGRGPSNVVLEAQIQQGDRVTNKKSVSTTSETTHINHRHYPLIPSLKASVTNPANLVEGAAAEGWIRGGLPSRDLTRDQDYAKQHTTNQY